MKSILQEILDCYSPSETDVLGSYTGIPLFGEHPIQDADDL